VLPQVSKGVKTELERGEHAERQRIAEEKAAREERLRKDCPDILRKQVPDPSASGSKDFRALLGDDLLRLRRRECEEWLKEAAVKKVAKE